MQKLIDKIFIVKILPIFIISSCLNHRQVNPKRVYMPDMYYSEAYEPYSKIEHNNITSNLRIFQINRIQKNAISSSLSPVIGTVSRNKYNLLPYNINNNQTGYELAKKNNISPFNKNIKRGKEMYTINCAICHGDTGDGQGILVQKEKILGVPNYKNIDITLGSIYHVIMYGKNMMGSYASQLNELDRWQIAEYVLQLKNS